MMPNVGSMLARRRRRSANIEPTSGTALIMVYYLRVIGLRRLCPVPSPPRHSNYLPLEINKSESPHSFRKQIKSIFRTSFSILNPLCPGMLDRQNKTINGQWQWIWFVFAAPLRSGYSDNESDLFLQHLWGRDTVTMNLIRFCSTSEVGIQWQWIWFVFAAPLRSGYSDNESDSFLQHLWGRDTVTMNLIRFCSTSEVGIQWQWIWFVFAAPLRSGYSDNESDSFLQHLWGRDTDGLCSLEIFSFSFFHHPVSYSIAYK